MTIERNSTKPKYLVICYFCNRTKSFIRGFKIIIKLAGFVIATINSAFTTNSTCFFNFVTTRQDICNFHLKINIKWGIFYLYNSYFHFFHDPSVVERWSGYMKRQAFLRYIFQPLSILAEQRYHKRTAQIPKTMPNYSIALIRKTVTKIQCPLMSEVHIQRFTFIFKDWYFCSTNCNLPKLTIWSSTFARVMKRLFDAAKAKWNNWEGGMAIDRAMKLKVRIGL